MPVGAIHGRLLTARTVGGVLGPVLVNYLRFWLVERGDKGVGVYAPTMFLMAGLPIIALLCNLAVRPVAARFQSAAAPPDAAGSHPADPASNRPAEILRHHAAPLPAMRLACYWLVVGILLAWGIWKTLMKLPVLFE